MGSEWETLTTASLINDGVLEIGDGYRAKNSELATEGIPFARAGNIAGGFDFEGADRVPDETLARVGSKKSQVGDVVFTSKGSVGRFAWVTRQTEPFVFSPQLCYWRSCDEARLRSRFLYYWMQGRECLNQIDALKGQTDMADYVSLRDQRSMRLTLPPPEEQHAVASVLGALDDKIESNERVSSGAVATLECFLREEIRSDGRECRLGDIVEFHNKRRRPLSAKEREARPGTVPYYGATGRFGFVDEPIFDHELLLVGEDGSVVQEDRRPVTQYIWGPAWVNNHAHVLTGTGMSTELAFLVVRNASVSDWVTGAVQPKLSMGNLKRVPVRVPTLESLPRIERLVSEVFALHRSMVAEAEQLGAIRNELLPKLVSGKIRIPAAEEIVEAGDDAALGEVAA